MDESRETIEHAIGLWRDGVEQIEKLKKLRTQSWEGWYQDYQTAVNIVLAFLQRYTTAEDLIHAYFREKRSETAIDEALQEVRRRNGDTRLLNSGLVEDAAYMARLKQLVAGL